MHSRACMYVCTYVLMYVCMYVCMGVLGNIGLFLEEYIVHQLGKGQMKYPKFLYQSALVLMRYFISQAHKSDLKEPKDCKQG